MTLHYLHYLHFGRGKCKRCRKCKAKKCTGESGDIGDIAKIVNIAMQKKWHEKSENCENSQISHFSQCKFLYKRQNRKRRFLICPKLPKMNQKLQNGELNELSEFFIVNSICTTTKAPRRTLSDLQPFAFLWNFIFCYCGGAITKVWNICWNVVPVD